MKGEVVYICSVCGREYGLKESPKNGKIVGVCPECDALHNLQMCEEWREQSSSSKYKEDLR